MARTCATKMPTVWTLSARTSVRAMKVTAGQGSNAQVRAMLHIHDASTIADITPIINIIIIKFICIAHSNRNKDYAKHFVE